MITPDLDAEYTVLINKIKQNRDINGIIFDLKKLSVCMCIFLIKKAKPTERLITAKHDQ